MLQNEVTMRTTRDVLNDLSDSKFLQLERLFVENIQKAAFARGSICVKLSSSPINNCRLSFYKLFLLF